MSNVVVPSHHVNNDNVVVADNLIVFRHVGTTNTSATIETSITYPKK